MFRKILAISASVIISGLMGCPSPTSPTTPTAGDTPPAITGTTTVFSSGLSPTDIADSSKWSKNYMINANDFYPPMRATTDAFYSGKYSVTTDSNRTALVHAIDGDHRITSGICGVQFYIMAKKADSINFTLEIGQYAGSSGGLCKAFGIGFDVRDSIKATNYDSYGGRTDKMVGAIQPNHWYKCKIEIDFTTKKTTYYIDNQKVDEGTLPTIEMYGIDRLVILRGLEYVTSDQNVIPCKDGPKQYYIDDVVLYTR